MNKFEEDEGCSTQGRNEESMLYIACLDLHQLTLDLFHVYSFFSF